MDRFEIQVQVRNTQWFCNLHAQHNSTITQTHPLQFTLSTLPSLMCSMRLLAVLTAAQLKQMHDTCKKEEDVVAFMTPFLKQLLDGSHRRQIYNSERFVWLPIFEIASKRYSKTSKTSDNMKLTMHDSLLESTPPLETTPHDQKPDLWFGPTFISQPTADKRNAHGDTLYAIPNRAYSHWFDCINLIEAKYELDAQGKLSNHACNDAVISV